MLPAVACLKVVVIFFVLGLTSTDLIFQSALFSTEQSYTTAMLGGATNHLHPSSKSVFTFSSEKVYMIFKLQFKYIVLVYIILFCRCCYTIT
uniref:Uncharacterized protein n=1 Tax=Panstrongylus lignarius TaxID=156445 RepID=A0A224Y228_9HEMI